MNTSPEPGGGHHLQKGRLRKPIDLSREQVARQIEQFLDGRGGAFAWDDFCTVPLTDAVLEDIRQRCLKVPVEFPPIAGSGYCSERGLAVFRAYVRLLREPVS